MHFEFKIDCAENRDDLSNSQPARMDEQDSIKRTGCSDGAIAPHPIHDLPKVTLVYYGIVVHEQNVLDFRRVSNMSRDTKNLAS